MTLDGSSSSALHLNFPPTAGAASRSTSGVSVHPVALFSILDHYLRRSDPEPVAAPADGEEAAPKSAVSSATPTRVIGTLLGTRSENDVEIRSCFAVPHNETDEQVQVDMDYHRQMYELHQRVNPDEVIVGW